jgi:crescentin
MLEQQLSAARSSQEMQIENLKAQLQREQLDRSMVEGALEAARKDMSRLLDDVSALRGRSLPENTMQDVLQQAA